VYGPPRLTRVLQAGLFLAVLVCLRVQYYQGAEHGRSRHREASRLQADVQAGLSCEELGTRHAPALYPDAHLLAERLRMLQHAGMGPYADTITAGTRVRK
jgi:hypothetical protein